MRLLLERFKLCALAILAVYRAHCKQLRGKGRRRNKQKMRARMRLRAITKLGGACACCGLGIEFAGVFTFHHINHNGEEHRRVLAASSIGVVQWILVSDKPGEGLFAVEALCSVCHQLTHDLGVCPHRWKRRREAP